MKLAPLVNTTALAICETFARQAEFEWAGSLALGGGPMLNGAPLVQLGGQTIPICKALDLAAEALAHGQSIPQAAQDIMAKPVIPHWVYALMAWFGWRQGAKKYGADKQLKRQPYLVTAK